MRVLVAAGLSIGVVAFAVERYLNPWTVRGRWRSVRPGRPDNQPGDSPDGD